MRNKSKHLSVSFNTVLHVPKYLSWSDVINIANYDLIQLKSSFSGNFKLYLNSKLEGNVLVKCMISPLS